MRAVMYCLVIVLTLWSLPVMAQSTESAQANSAICLMPFAIADRWDEYQTPDFDPDDTFDLVDAKGRPLAAADFYMFGVTSYDPGGDDEGLQIVLKPGSFEAVDLPGSVGADDYRGNIANCNTVIVSTGTLLEVEPGNMIGPTTQGLDDLIAKDPGATWDEGCNCVHSAIVPSPRVVAILLYDPVERELAKETGRTELKVVNYLGVFVETVTRYSITVRVTPLRGVTSGN